MSGGQKLPFSQFTTTPHAASRSVRRMARKHFSHLPDTAAARAPSRAGFSATLSEDYLGNLLLSHFDFDGQRFERDRRKLTLDGMDHYLVQLYSTGGLNGVAYYRASASLWEGTCKF